MKIEPFGVEQWMNAWETKCRFNLAETCVDSLTIGELLQIAGRNDDLSALLPMKMTYGAIEGAERLRAAIAGLYQRQTPANIVTTHGTIGANMLVHKALVERGDKVVAIVPTYQQHYSIPEALGAEVVQLRLREENAWLPDLDELKRLARGARLIALTNPNNPTGALMGSEMLECIAQIARAEGAWILCDEVYRGTEQSGILTPSMAEIYERGISTASVSKAFSLAGLRCGWIAAPDEVIEKVLVQRDYDTISVGQVDEFLATMAVEASDRIFARGRAITSTNLGLVGDWLDTRPALHWVRPDAGTTALIRYDRDEASWPLCERLLAETGVMLTPGSAFGLEGHLRIGFGNPTDALRDGLHAMVRFWD